MYKKVMVIEKCENIFLYDDLGYRQVHTYDNALCMDSFFNDEFDEYEAVKSAIEKLIVLKHSRREITFVFPTDGLGTGLAQMKTKSPKLFKYMNEQLNKHFGVGYE